MVNINKNEYYKILIIHEEKLKYILIFIIHYHISITLIKKSSDLIVNFFIYFFILSNLLFIYP